MPPTIPKRYVTASIKAAAQVHGSAQSRGTQCQNEDLSTRRAGASSLEVHDWRLPTTEGELLPKEQKGKKSPPLLATTLSCPTVITHGTSHNSSGLPRALRPPLRQSPRCKRRGGRDYTHGDAVAPPRAVVGAGGGRVMSPVDSHDYHCGYFPILLGLFLSLFAPPPLLVFTEATRPLSFCDSA